MVYPSGITDQELLKELHQEIVFQRRMVRSLHLLPRDLPQEQVDRLWDIYDRYASALCVAYFLLTKVDPSW